MTFYAPTLKEPFAAAGTMLVTINQTKSHVTIKYMASAVYTHNAHAYPAHYGIYHTPHNNKFISWLPDGYQKEYTNVTRYDSVETEYLILNFELRCIDE